MSEYFEFQMNKRNSDSTSNYLERKHRFNKDREKDRCQALNDFKDNIGASLSLALNDKSCYYDDSFLYRFLYARKFQCNKALKLLEDYLSYKKRNQSLLLKLNIFDEKIQQSLRDGIPTVLKQRDRKGRKVILFLASNWDPIKYSLEDIFRAILLSLDLLLDDVQNQALGFVIIVDWTNFPFNKSRFVSPKILKLMIEGLQDCFPAKFKAIHFIAQPWFISAALTVVKPFLTDYIKDRITVHGTNLTSLHTLINKHILPPELGGEASCVNTLDWYHFSLERSQTTEPHRTYRIIEPAFYTKTSIPEKNVNLNLISKSSSNSKPIL